jgi:hypothetical protein
MTDIPATPRPGIIAASTALDLYNAAINSPAVNADINQAFGASAHTAIGSAIGAMLLWSAQADLLPASILPLPPVVVTLICGAGAAIGAKVAALGKQTWLNWKVKHQAPAPVAGP